jgi:hypothetical protein
MRLNRLNWKDWGALHGVRCVSSSVFCGYGLRVRGARLLLTLSLRDKNKDKSKNTESQLLTGSLHIKC